MARRLKALGVMALVSIALAACGGEHPASHSGGADGMETTESRGRGAFSFGEPADSSESDRTVEVAALDPYEFDPQQIEVEAGETITFLITNEGNQDHEFVLGDETYQDEHEGEMSHSDMDMNMNSEENGVEVAPGTTERITWTFPEEGTVLYACHEPGHYDGGMVGTISLGS